MPEYSEEFCSVLADSDIADSVGAGSILTFSVGLSILGPGLRQLHSKWAWWALWLIRKAFIRDVLGSGPAQGISTPKDGVYQFTQEPEG